MLTDCFGGESKDTFYYHNNVVNQDISARRFINTTRFWDMRHQYRFYLRKFSVTFWIFDTDKNLPVTTVMLDLLILDTTKQPKLLLRKTHMVTMWIESPNSSQNWYLYLTMFYLTSIIYQCSVPQNIIRSWPTRYFQSCHSRFPTIYVAWNNFDHYNDVITGAIASQITKHRGCLLNRLSRRR